MTLELSFSDYKFEDVHQLCSKEIDYLKVIVNNIWSGSVERERKVPGKARAGDNGFAVEI